MFSTMYPVFCCRSALWDMRRKQGETPSHYVARVMKAGKQAQLDKLGPDDILAHVIHHGMDIHALQERWNRKESVSLSTMNVMIAAYERGENNENKSKRDETTKALVNAVSEEAATVAAASLTPGNRQAMQRDRQAPPGMQCFVCGGAHLVRTCKKNAKTLTCDTCKRIGHVSKVCHLQNLRQSRRPVMQQAPQQFRPQQRRQFYNGAQANAATFQGTLQQQMAAPQMPPHVQQMQGYGANDQLAAQAAAAHAAAVQPFMGPATVTQLRESLPTPRLQM